MIPPPQRSARPAQAPFQAGFASQVQRGGSLIGRSRNQGCGSACVNKLPIVSLC